MAITNQDRVGKAMDLLRQGLAPFVDREVQEKVRIGAVNRDTVRRFSEDPTLAKRPIPDWDIAALLKLMVAAWRDAGVDVCIVGLGTPHDAAVMEPLADALAEVG